MPEEAEFPGNAMSRPVLVVAHPDDEALWFSSILKDVFRIVVCFRASAGSPELAESRRRSLADHPLSDRIVDLALDECGSFDRADWAEPVETDEGLALSDPGAAAAYARNAAAIESALPALLDDATAVFTHNPWGEYGHEDHVQVCRVVTRAATRLELPVWYGLYAGDKALPLLRRYLRRGRHRYVLRTCDETMGEAIAAVYRRHGAWTWFDDYRWFRHEAFVRGPLVAETAAAIGWLGPINLLLPRPPPAAAARPERPSGTARLTRRLRRLFASGRKEA